MLTAITHNLIFNTEENAARWDDAVLNTFKGVLKTTRYANVILVDEKTYVRLDSHGWLDEGWDA